MPSLPDILGNPALNGVYRLTAAPDAWPADLVPVLDGRTLTDREALLASLGHALDLPDYYGANWDALEECLVDFSWRDGPIRLVLQHADALPPAQTDTLLDVFAGAAAQWAGQGRPCSLFVSGLDREDLPAAD